ncbi:unnamed protein product [Sphagnum jensenii]|uniref:Protein kinase domain-containing protein n=1 Tax=Sphagnum jensenii TaxID=128206 RepID=A0ABP0W638_9BRYO
MRLFFAELNPTTTATSRQFYAELPDNDTRLINPFTTPLAHQTMEEDYSGTVPNFVLLFCNQTISATSPGPLVNAMEIFELSQNRMAILTNEQDALAIDEIKSSYPNLAEWTGDPCLPSPHPWLTCSNNGGIYKCDALDNNELHGSLPDFSNVPNLTTLNLASNNLNGSFPPYLMNSSIFTLQEINFDNNNFSGKVNLLQLRESCFLQETQITVPIANNDISELEPSWEDETSPYLALGNCTILLGGNPICNKLDLNSSNAKISSNPKIAYLQQLDCRYKNIALRTLDTSQRGKTKLIWILSTTLSIALILGGVICVVILRKYQMKSHVLHEIQQEFAKQEVQPTLYSYSVLKGATRNFHQDNKLGQGAFGIVYKGILLDGTKLAIKLLTKTSEQAIDDFLNEVVSITGVKHINLVKLKGCCLHGAQHLLVYELVENKNLAEAMGYMNKFLHYLYIQMCFENTLFLDWPTRFHICVGIARGLVYLHEEIQPCIIHRDIKAPNILLDNNLNAKIADFGLARLFLMIKVIYSHKNKLEPCKGYMSPEYASFGQLSTKVDVYSFGVLLLEIISGRKTILETATNKMNLVEWAWILHKKNMLVDLIDQKVNNTLVETEVQCVINVALLCLQIEAKRRPSMSQALAMLQGEVNFLKISPYQNEIDVSSHMEVSANEVGLQS